MKRSFVLKLVWDILDQLFKKLVHHRATKYFLFVNSILLFVTHT